VLLAADVEARGAEASELGERGAYITPRALMSILRLSQVRLALTISSARRSTLQNTIAPPVTIRHTAAD
jgi:hypothetical protein